MWIHVQLWGRYWSFCLLLILNWKPSPEKKKKKKEQALRSIGAHLSLSLSFSPATAIGTNRRCCRDWSQYHNSAFCRPFGSVKMEAPQGGSERDKSNSSSSPTPVVATFWKGIPNSKFFFSHCVLIWGFLIFFFSNLAKLNFQLHIGTSFA